MSRFVVDASVAIKWYVPEVHSGEADRLLTFNAELFAPDLLYPEIGNILWKKIMREGMTEEKARSIMQAVAVLPLTVWRTGVLAESALTIANRVKRSFYDGLYLALAMTADCRLVTADLKLYNALKGISPFKKRLLWIEEVPGEIS